MYKSWHNWTMLAIESQQVIALRMMRMAGGGPKAQREANRLVAEKLTAATHATTRLMMGDTPDKVVRAYRTRVRRNARRLSK
jgi:hypothetical protein